MTSDQPVTRPSGDGKQQKKRKGRRRAVPQRTCVGCRSVNPKRGMVRVVRTPEGTIEVDPTGKRPGRGAYLCQRKSCWERALKRRSLDHALKTELDDATRAALLAYAQSLPEDEDENPMVSEEPGLGENESRRQLENGRG